MGHWRRSSLVALAMLTLMISGCGGQNRPAVVSVGTHPNGVAAAIGLDAIAKRGKVRVHVTNDNWEFLHSGKIHFDDGLGPDVARRITEIVWGTNVKAEMLLKPSRSEAIALLKSGEADLVLDSWVPNGEDLASLHASPPFYTESLRVMVRTQGVIKQIEDLDGKGVAYVEDKVAEVPRYFKNRYPKLRIEFERVVSYSNPPMGGTVALAGPASELAPQVTAGRGRLLPERLEAWNYSVLVHKQNTQLADAVDKAIRQMTESGELAQLVKKWGLDI